MNSVGHIHVDLTIRTDKGEVMLKDVLVDTGAAYTALPAKTMEWWARSGYLTKLASLVMERVWKPTSTPRF